MANTNIPQTGIDSFADLERYRLSLEENVKKLQESLRHWQTWEAEYEGLQEEMLGLGDGHTEARLKRVGDEFGGILLNDKEIKLLFEDAHGQQRNSSQIIGLLNRRIDYVRDNVKSLTLLLQSAESKATASSVLSQPDIRNEEGLPLTEIREELDENGNVISSSTTLSTDTAPHVVEALRKAGVNGLQKPEIPRTVEKPDHSRDELAERERRPEDEVSILEPLHAASLQGDEAEQPIPVPSEKSEDNEKESMNRKKSVSFAEGTKAADATDSSRRHHKKDQRAANALSAKMEAYLHSGSITNDIGKIDEHQKHIKDTPSSGDKAASSILDGSLKLRAEDGERFASVKPISMTIPQGESFEDAELRRQMIKYNMEDVGAVVAEMDIDDDESNAWLEGDRDEDQDDSSNEEDEDSFGRTKRRVVSDDYRKEMEALEQKLNGKFTPNVGPRRDEADSVKTEHMGDQNTTNISNIQNAPKSNRSSKVYPAQPIQPAQTYFPASSHESSTELSHKSNRQVAPLKDPSYDHSTAALLPSISKPTVEPNVIERSVPTAASSLHAIPPSSSALKSASKHASTPPIFSTHKPSSASHNSIINTAIIERPYISTNTDTNTYPSPPSELDEFDPALLQQQAATEYFRTRNRMIHRQGGFLASAEEEANEGRVPLTEEEGGEKKMSRFKAARLRKG